MYVWHFSYFIFIILQSWHLRGIKISFACFFSQKFHDFRDPFRSQSQFILLLQLDTVRAQCSYTSCYKRARLRRPLPIFGIPCIPPGYKAPIVFPCLAPQGKFSITLSLLLGLFLLWEKEQSHQSKLWKSTWSRA